MTGDSTYIRRLNRRLIVEKIIEHVHISRADLAKITGLNKATISTQVANLLNDNLITEFKQEHSTVGRRPIMLSINGRAGYVLGVDLDYKIINYWISDLSGNFIESKTTTFDTEDYDVVYEILTKDILAYQKAYASSQYGLVQAIIGVHGTVSNEQVIRLIPRLQWRNKNLKADLKRVIDIPISIENTANLSVYAEKVYTYPESNHILGISIGTGVGAGIINDGKLIKGHQGYAGEIGHMIITPDGEQCRCGNHGCLELYAAETVIFNELKEKLARPTINYKDIKNLLAANDPITKETMTKFIRTIAIALNNMINAYNPEVLIINSKLLKTYPNAIEAIEKHLGDSTSLYQQIVLSDLEKEASLLGACALGIRNFFNVEKMILRNKRM